LAGAQALTITGSVYEDHTALAERAGFTPAANVTVHLYRDGGDRVPSADDTRIATATTDAAGVYVLNSRSAGDHWVVVDSHTFARNGAWPEETFGPAGSLCAQPDGGTRSNYFEGPCFGGRTAAGSDDATTIATSEHVALVRDSATKADFAFSFDAVTSVRDGEAIQGSLRQFIVNANAVGGANHMRFVPLAAADVRRDTSFGVPPRWWMIAFATPLPELHDADTIIDGTAYNFLSPASVQDIHPGRIGEAATVKPNERPLPHLEKPELELQLTGQEGIVCAARCGIRAIALHGAALAIVARADARIEHVLIGAAPDGIQVETPGSVGLQLESGTTLARHLFVTLQSRAGVLVGHEARLDGERLEISRCGDPRTGAGIVLLSDGSSIRASSINANGGAGIIIGSFDGTVVANGNTIDGSTISSNQGGVILGAGSSRNVIARNDIMWNSLGGVTIAPFKKDAPPRDNRLSANRFDENGLRPIILDLSTDDANQLWRGTSTCTRNMAAANDGITPPQVTNIRIARDEVSARVTLHGRACPGQIVELYQSFVTSGIREDQPETPRIRNENSDRETGTSQNRDMMLPSIGEFNYLGSASTAADGTFDATFPLPLVRQKDIAPTEDEENHVWASQVLRNNDPDDCAFSAIAIDATGNTSEMSVRRRAD
jgi:hypothetical protein